MKFQLNGDVFPFRLLSAAKTRLPAGIDAKADRSTGYQQRKLPLLPVLAIGMAWSAMASAALSEPFPAAQESAEAATLAVSDLQTPALDEAAAELALTSVEQLSDVSPNDWAYQALQNLVERYACLAGYPDGTFRGGRSLTRYEFAAGLSACLDAIADSVVTDAPSAEELAVLQRLQGEFASELALLETQVADLEARTAELEANAFSTTTRLRGEVVFSAEQLFGSTQANGSGDPLPQSFTFGSRARLNFDTSFTGRDLLRIRLDALNPPVLNAPVTGTNMTRLAFDLNTGNSFEIGKLFYRFPVGDNLRIQIDAGRGAYTSTFISTYNPDIANGISGAISRFGRFNPIYYQGALGTGITGQYDFGDSVSLALGYIAGDNFASDPDVGLFGGGYAALAQLDIRPSDSLQLGLTYVHSYYPAGAVRVTAGTGSRLANAPFGNIATSADHLGLQSSLQLGPGATLSGWAGLSFAEAAGDSATLFNWALTLGLPDLGGQGNFGGLIVGQPPRVISNTSGVIDGASAWHLEAYYRYQLSRNISLIPGFLVLLNPEHDSANDTIWLASFRTVFRF